MILDLARRHIAVEAQEESYRSSFPIMVISISKRMHGGQVGLQIFSVH